MRNRFFIIILTTLALSAIGINFVHVTFFKSQRLKLIDKQITESSSELIASKEFKAAVSKSADLEETISMVLKGARIGKVFILRDQQSKILYQSFNASLLQTQIPVSPEWVAVETENEYVRVRNVPLQGKGLRVLQVGLVLDKNFLNWEIIDDRLINYVIGIVLALFFASVLLTLTLLSPLRQLILHLQDTTANLTNMRPLNPLPKRLIKHRDGFWARSDEFASLLTTVQKLIDRINLNYKLTRSWTLQMAHELKTPLAIMHADAQAENKRKQLPPEFSENLLAQLESMSNTIGQFLEWGELENSQVQKNLFALRFQTEVKKACAKLESLADGRIDQNIHNDFSLIANPSHVEQLLANLLTNALKYSPKDKKVEVIVEARTLIVRDQGPGVPLKVIERLGEPFNIGPHDQSRLTGHGLGLAWVCTVCKIYGWKLEIQENRSKTQIGAEIKIQFPVENADEIR